MGTLLYVTRDFLETVNFLTKVSDKLKTFKFLCLFISLFPFYNFILSVSKHRTDIETREPMQYIKKKRNKVKDISLLVSTITVPIFLLHLQ